MVVDAMNSFTMDTSATNSMGEEEVCATRTRSSAEKEGVGACARVCARVRPVGRLCRAMCEPHSSLGVRFSTTCDVRDARGVRPRERPRE